VSVAEAPAPRAHPLLAFAQRYAGAFISLLALAGVVYWASRQEAPKLPDDASSLALVAGAVAMYAVATLLRGWRWHNVLRAAHVEHRAVDAYALVVVGYMGNTVLPARGGEVLRILLLGARSSAKRREILGAIIAERLLDVLALVILFAIITGTGVAGTVTGRTPALIAAAAVVPAAVAVWLYLRLRRAGRFEAFAEKARPFLRSSRMLMNARGALLALVTGVVWLLEGAICAVIARALDIQIDVIEGAFLIVLTSFFALIPAAPGYVGTFDAAMLFGLKALGVAGGTAVSFVLLVRFVFFVPVTIVGLALLVLRYGGLNQLRMRNRPAE
jgi:uncharacterized membrane protein YbhN (UPF0104 family)